MTPRRDRGSGGRFGYALQKERLIFAAARRECLGRGSGCGVEGGTCEAGQNRKSWTDWRAGWRHLEVTVAMLYLGRTEGRCMNGRGHQKYTQAIVDREVVTDRGLVYTPWFGRRVKISTGRLAMTSDLAGGPRFGTPAGPVGEMQARRHPRQRAPPCYKGSSLVLRLPVPLSCKVTPHSYFWARHHCSLLLQRTNRGIVRSPVFCRKRSPPVSVNAAPPL
jgi:hypothetical protein